MIAFTLSQKDLNRAVTICNQISSKKSEVEIFTLTKFVVQKERLELIATNGQVFYKAALLPFNIDFAQIETSFLVKTEMLASIVGLISDDSVLLEINLDKKTMQVQGSKSKHTLRISTDEADSYQLPIADNEKLQLNLKVSGVSLMEANRAAFVSVGLPKNVYQPEFLNICYTLDKDNSQLLIVSTDRFRITKTALTVEVLETGSELVEAANFLFLPKSLQLLNSALGSEAEVNLRLESDLAWVQFGGHLLILRYGDGKYPDYNKIIPQSFACSFQLSVKDMNEALRQVAILARNNSTNKSVKVDVKPSDQKMLLSAQTQEGDSSESSLSLENYQGTDEAWGQSFNIDYLIEYIGSLKSENMLWEANPGKPSVLSPAEQKDKQFYLVSGLK